MNEIRFAKKKQHKLKTKKAEKSKSIAKQVQRLNRKSTHNHSKLLLNIGFILALVTTIGKTIGMIVIIDGCLARIDIVTMDGTNGHSLISIQIIVD